MIEERLKSIMDEIAIDEGYTNWEEMYQKSFIFPERVVKAMKQAVNESVEQCAFFAQVTDGEYVEDELKGADYTTYRVDKESILNLKVK